MNSTAYYLVPTNHNAVWLTRERGINQPQCESAKINPERILILAKARKQDPRVKRGLQNSPMPTDHVTLRQRCQL